MQHTIHKAYLKPACREVDPCCVVESTSCMFVAYLLFAPRHGAQRNPEACRELRRQSYRQNICRIFAILLTLCITKRSGVSRRSESCIVEATVCLFVAYLPFTHALRHGAQQSLEAC